MKLRIRMAKQHLAKFHSHLDVQRTMERALRRAALPIAYTQGFNPHPRMSFASALATGSSSEGEFIDIELSEPMAPEVFVAQANRFCPPGLQLVEARVAPDKGDSLFSLIDVAAYRLTVKVPGVLGAGAVEQAAAAFLDRDVVEVEKETKRGTRLVNIRELVYSLAVETILPDPGGDAVLVNLRTQLQSGSQGSLKPEALLEGLKLVDPALAPAELVGEHRLMLYHRDEATGALVEPWDL